MALQLKTWEKAIIETMPFSKELVSWCKNHPDFTRALKIIYPEKFLHLGAIVTSYCSYRPKDQVIGIYSYAYRMKQPIFKQDFVINKENLSKKFILYTRFQNKSSLIKDISEFYKTYGQDNNYVNTHHLSFNQLPNKVKPAGLRAIYLAERIIENGLLIEEKRTDKIYKEIKMVKADNWKIKTKL